MKIEELLKQSTTPLGSGAAFPRGPYRFHDREYLNITYRTDAAALRKIVPEPLEIDDPLVRFEVMRMPDTTGLGNYTECGQAIVVKLGSTRGEYLHAMYVDSHPAIASGREISAYPK
jgi:acetoacetate decarboxylase